MPTISAGKLVALLAIVAAIGLVTATGAFTSVTADRTASVSVANESSALLALEPHQNSPNGQGAYANYNGDLLEIDFSNVNQANPEATTEILHVFNITNQGTQPVGVWITGTGANSGAVQFYNDSISGATNITGSAANAVTLTVGQTAQISMKIDTTGLSPSDVLLTDITIHADASQAS